MEAGEMELRFAELAHEWRALVLALPSFRPVSDAAFAALRDEAAAIRARGAWVSGPGDMLSVLGRQRDELVHSRLIGWLLNPTGRHGLGERFLRAFLAKVWPNEQFDLSGRVTIELERTRSGVSEVTGETLEARADLLIGLEAMVIVVENKVDAGEGWNQAERLYWPWANDAVETRWIFLSPSGREPVTATSDVALAAWRSMSYEQVRRALEAALADAPDSSGSGRASARQYLATLDSQRR